MRLLLALCVLTLVLVGIKADGGILRALWDKVLDKKFNYRHKSGNRHNSVELSSSYGANDRDADNNDDADGHASDAATQEHKPRIEKRDTSRKLQGHMHEHFNSIKERSLDETPDYINVEPRHDDDGVPPSIKSSSMPTQPPIHLEERDALFSGGLQNIGHERAKGMAPIHRRLMRSRADRTRISRSVNKKRFPNIDPMFGQVEMQLHRISHTENDDIVSIRAGKVEQKRREKRHILGEWLRDGGRISGRIQTPGQWTEPPKKVSDETETRGQWTEPTNRVIDERETRGQWTETPKKVIDETETRGQWIEPPKKVIDGTKTRGQWTEPPRRAIDERETGIAEGTTPTNDNIVQHKPHVNSATRLARFLDRRPHDGGISIKVDDNFDLGILPDDDRMRVGPEANAPDVRVFSEDERVEYGFSPDGHFVGHEQDTKQVASKDNKRVEIRYYMNEPSTQDAHSDGMKYIEFNDQNSLEKRDERLFGRSDIGNTEITADDQRAGNNDTESGVLSENIKNLFSNNPTESMDWEEPDILDNCWSQAMLAKRFQFSPSCNMDGTYASKQCYLERCWCTDKKGRPVVTNFDQRFYYNEQAIALLCPTVEFTQLESEPQK